MKQSGSELELKKKPVSIEASQFIANFDQYIAAAESGERFQLTRDGVFVCNLLPPEN